MFHKEKYRNEIMKHLKKYNETSEFPKWVMCVNNDGFKMHFAIGKIYKCEDQIRHSGGDIFYTVIDNYNEEVTLLAKRFIDIPQGEINESDTSKKWVIYAGGGINYGIRIGCQVGKIYQIVDETEAFLKDNDLYRLGDESQKITIIQINIRFHTYWIPKSETIPLPNIQENNSIKEIQENHEFPKWVICVDDQEENFKGGSNKKSGISQGKIYRCLRKSYGDMYLIVNDNGIYAILNIKRFIDVPQGEINENNSQNEFPKWVICVDVEDAFNITLGKIYKCMRSSDLYSHNAFIIINDENREGYYDKNRFIDIPQGNIKS
jgi:hypothetical protein